VLNCPIGTVMSRLHNARKRLRSALGPMLLVLVCLAAALAGAAAWTQAWAQTPPAAPAAAPKGTVHFEVRVLQASNPPGPQPAPGGKQPAGPAPGAPADGQMDERLKQIVPRLRKAFAYRDYTPLDHHKVDVDFGASKRLPAPGDRWLEVTPRDLQGKSVRMQVRLLKGEKSEVTMNVVAGPGTPWMVARDRQGPNALIFIIWADPVPDAPAAK